MYTHEKSRNFSYWIFETLNSRMEFLQEVVLYSVHVGKIRFLHEVLVRHTQLKSGCKLGSIGLSLDMNFEEKSSINGWKVLYLYIVTIIPTQC